MPDYGAGPGPAVHALHFTECASRLPAVLILPITACSGVRPGPVNRHGFEIAGSAGVRLAPITGPGAGRTAVERVAASAHESEKRRTAGLEMSRGRSGEEGGGVAAARWARPAGRIGHRGASRPVPASVSRGRDCGNFQNCPCIAVRVPVYTFSHGGVAHPGERLTGSQEVGVWNPPRLHPSIE